MDLQPLEAVKEKEQTWQQTVLKYKYSVDLHD